MVSKISIHCKHYQATLQRVIVFASTERFCVVQQSGGMLEHLSLLQSLRCEHTPCLPLDVCLFLQVDRASFARGDSEEAELLLCGGRKNWRSVLSRRMFGLCNGLYHLPLHGDALWEGNKRAHHYIRLPNTKCRHELKKKFWCAHLFRFSLRLHSCIHVCFIGRWLM